MHPPADAALWQIPTTLIGVFLLTWLTYFDVLKGKWLIDDGQSIAIYRGDWKDPDQNQSPDKWKQSPLSFHVILRHLRWLYGIRPNPNKNWKRDNQLPYISDPKLHHRLNIVLCGGCAGLLYLFLNHLFGHQIALLSTALFIVHPFGTYTVGWIAGIGYLVGLFFTLLALNITLITSAWVTPLGVVSSVILFGLFQFLAVQAQFATVGTTAVLALLGYWPHAIVSGLLTISYCTPVIKDALVLRTKIFKEQAMGASTTVYPKKLYVVLKTFAYYLRVGFFPKRMGLYHTFGYHYELPDIESADKHFWWGVASAVGFLVLVFFVPLPIQLGLVWFIAFLFIYLNWITINQFVTERYAWMPVAGLCIIVAYLTCRFNLIYLWCALFGIALMRTWSHIPTFYNLENFYRSNIQNFPDSEVAYGNLGVTQMGMGFLLSAHDSFLRGTQINPEYDVNWYNLYSVCKQLGNFDGAKICLEKATNARVCHFREQWKNELAQFTQELEKRKRPPLVQQPFTGVPLANAVEHNRTS